MQGEHNPMFGKKQRQSTKDKIREKNTGKKHTIEFKNKLSLRTSGQNNPFYGKHHSEETKRKIGLKSIGRKPNLGKKYSEEAKKRMSLAHMGILKGRVISEEVRKKMSKAMLGKPHFKSRGENHPLWKGGITDTNDRVRHSLEYKIWVRAIFERDNYTCVWCKKRGGNLEADHIKRFADFPELRFAIDNGRTLCVSCHRKTDTWGRKKQNN